MWNCLGQTYACNNLTSFWNAAHAITGNGNYANLLKSILEKFVKAHQVNLFLAGFSHLKPLCATSPRPNDQNPKTANSSDTNLELDMPKLLELAHLVHYVYTPILFLPKWRYEAHSTRLRIRSEVLGTIHLLRKHLYSTKLNLITKVFIQTGFYHQNKRV